MSDELTLNVSGSWTTEDWEKSVPKFIPETITVAPIRHPDNDDSWCIGVYDPTEPPLGIGHRLRGFLHNVHCKTYEEALQAASFLVVTPESIDVRPDLTTDQQLFLMALVPGSGVTIAL
jgi:hypothetical protein